MPIYLFAEPSAAPPDLGIESTTPSSVTCAWDEMECDKSNGQITGYQFRFYVEGSLQNVEFIEGADSTGVRIDQLLPCKHLYKVSVAAVNDAGLGPESKLVQLGGEFPGELYVGH